MGWGGVVEWGGVGCGVGWGGVGWGAGLGWCTKNTTRTPSIIHHNVVVVWWSAVRCGAVRCGAVGAGWGGGGGVGWGGVGWGGGGVGWGGVGRETTSIEGLGWPTVVHGPKAGSCTDPNPPQPWSCADQGEPEITLKKPKPKPLGFKVLGFKV